MTSSAQEPEVITINAKKYNITSLSDQVKEAVGRVQVADIQIQRTRDQLKILTVGRETLLVSLQEELAGVKAINEEWPKNNEDEKFNKDDIIYKDKPSEATFDELIFNTSKVKPRKQMHSCEWDIFIGNEPIICTRDFVPTAYTLSIKLDFAGIVRPRALGDFKDGGIAMLVEPLTDIPS